MPSNIGRGYAKVQSPKKWNGNWIKTFSYDT